MEQESTGSAPAWRHKLPLLIGLCFGGLAFLYLVLPGVCLGLLVRIGVIDPFDSEAKELAEIVLCVPMYLAEKVRPIEAFYRWQFNTITGDR
jgi:hypothetical protein